MAVGGDPYRVLGVPEGASVADVKRAYRLLAKRHHPDAGEGSVSRFLEIQAAYEVLVRSAPAKGDRPATTRSPGRRPAQQGQRTAGSRRTSGERAGDPGAPPTPGTEWARQPRDAGEGSAAGAGDRSTPRAGAASSAGGAGTADRARRGHAPRKATLGSTTYDEAGEIVEPTWQGADWYGPVSGTYWTVNPKEYADPRKHGPEYTARWAGRAGIGAPAPAPRSSRGPIPGAAAAAPPEWSPRSRVPPAPASRPGPGVGSRAWPRPLERLVVGMVGWLPFGTLLATTVSLPGGLLAMLPLQVAGFAGMLWAPRVAWASAGGLAAVLGFAIPGIAALAAMGVAVRPGGPAPAGVIVLAALAWCGGAAVAAGGRLIGQPWRARP